MGAMRRECERLRQRNAELEEQARTLSMLQEMVSTVASELRLDLLPRQMAVAALRLTGAEACAVYLADGAGALVASAVETGQSAADSGIFALLDPAAESRPGRYADGAEHTEDEVRMELGTGLAGWVAEQAELVLVADLEHDPRFAPETFAPDAGVLGARPSALLAMPVVCADLVLGVVEVAYLRAGAAFDASGVELIRTLAMQAAPAIANAQLYQRLRRERERMLGAQEDEHEQLAQEMRNGVGRKLARLVMQIELAEHLARQEPEKVVGELRAVRQTALVATRELRQMLFALRPLALETEHGGLVTALETYLLRFRGGAGPEMSLRAEYARRLPHEAEAAAFAVLREAIANVLNHANAQNCWVEIREYPDKVVAAVRDDGDGFDMRAVQAEYERSGHWGLLSMMERAASVSAKLTIASQPGKGTILSVELPR
jgi:signal transduction histidine kinase